MNWNILFFYKKHMQNKVDEIHNIINEEYINNLWDNWETSFKPSRQWQRKINWIWYDTKSNLKFDLNVLWKWL